MGAGVDPGSTSGNVQTRGRRAGRVAAGTRTQQSHNSCGSDHDTLAATRDIKRTYRTIRGGKTSEVHDVHISYIRNLIHLWSTLEGMQRERHGAQNVPLFHHTYTNTCTASISNTCVQERAPEATSHDPLRMYVKSSMIQNVYFLDSRPVVGDT